MRWSADQKSVSRSQDAKQFIDLILRKAAPEEWVAGILLVEDLLPPRNIHRTQVALR